MKETNLHLQVKGMKHKTFFFLTSNYCLIILFHIVFIFLIFNLNLGHVKARELSGKSQGNWFSKLSKWE